MVSLRRRKAVCVVGWLCLEVGMARQQVEEGLVVHTDPILREQLNYF
jgi:hypothetical protein